MKLLIISILLINLTTASILGVMLIDKFDDRVQFPHSSNLVTSGPQDMISEKQIVVTKDKVIINVENADWSQYADTHSMEPLINANANGINIVPDCFNIETGDIIVYKSKINNKMIVHRVVGIENNNGELQFIMKGDNNSSVDPENIKCDQIKFQLIGIIY